jgi:hypothetical protein
MKTLHAVGNMTPDRVTALKISHRLLTLSEAMLCPIRCVDDLNRKDRNHAQEATFWWLFFSSLGAAGEFTKHVRSTKAISEVIDRAGHRYAGLKPLIARIRAVPPDRSVRVAMRARDKYWAHVDEDVSTSFVAALTGTKADPPMVESVGMGTVGDTASSWPRKAWFRDLTAVGGLASDDEASELTHELFAYIKDAAVIARQSAASNLRDAGFVLVEGDESGR